MIVILFSSGQNRQAEGFVDFIRTTKSSKSTQHFSYLQPEKKGFARSGDDRRIMPSSLYKKRKNPRNIAQQTRDRPRPKKVQLAPEALTAPIIHPGTTISFPRTNRLLA